MLAGWGYGHADFNSDGNVRFDSYANEAIYASRNGDANRWNVPTRPREKGRTAVRPSPPDRRLRFATADPINPNEKVRAIYQCSVYRVPRGHLIANQSVAVGRVRLRSGDPNNDGNADARSGG